MFYEIICSTRSDFWFQPFWFHFMVISWFQSLISVISDRAYEISLSVRPLDVNVQCILEASHLRKRLWMMTYVTSIVALQLIPPNNHLKIAIVMEWCHFLATNPWYWYFLDRKRQIPLIPILWYTGIIPSLQLYRDCNIVSCPVYYNKILMASNEYYLWLITCSTIYRHWYFPNLCTCMYSVKQCDPLHQFLTFQHGRINCYFGENPGSHIEDYISLFAFSGCVTNVWKSSVPYNFSARQNQLLLWQKPGKSHRGSHFSLCIFRMCHKYLEILSTLGTCASHWLLLGICSLTDIQIDTP